MARTRSRRGGPGWARAAGARGRTGAAPGSEAGARSLGAAGARTDRPLPRRLGRLFPTPTLLLRAPCRSPFHLRRTRRSHVTLRAPPLLRPPPPAPRPPSQIGRERASQRASERGGGRGRAAKATGQGAPAVRSVPGPDHVAAGSGAARGAGKLAVGKGRAPLQRTVRIRMPGWDWDASCVVLESET